MINVGLGVNYSIGSTFNVGLRYDFITESRQLSAGDVAVNAFTLNITKRFE
jgi:hypothetical protein